jgi:hypothetical protein
MIATTPITADCKHISLAVFRRCLLYKDYSGLGEGTPEEIAARWLELYSYYCQRRGGVKFSAMLGQVRDIQCLASRIERIETLIAAAKCVTECADDLIAEGYHVDPDALPEVYLQQLDVIRAKMAPDRMRLNRLRRELAEPNENKDEEKEREAIEEDFELLLIELSRFMGYEITDDVTVYKFCNMIDRMEAHVKAQAKTNAGSI